MRKNNLSFQMLTNIKEVDAEKRMKKVIAIFQEEDVSLLAIQEDVKRCEEFYRKYFSRTVKLSSVKIPEQKFGMDRLFIMLPGISEHRILTEETKQWQKKNKNFSVDAPGDLDHLIDDRNSNKEPYAWWGRNSPEPDLMYKNMSGNLLREAGVAGETLKERLLQGFMYWNETGDFLDKRNTTICTGTQNEVGEFPTVDFGSRTKGICISWVKPGIARPDMMAREIAC